MIPLDQVRLNFTTHNIWLLNLCLALIMFGVALEIKWDDFRRLVREPRAALTGLVAQFILLPAVTFLLVLIVQPQPSIALGMILVASCPGGNISNFLAHLAKGNTALSVSLTAAGTVLAVVMTPINFEFWAGLYPPAAGLLRSISLDALDLFEAVLIVAGIPLVLGMLFAHYRAVWAAKIAKAIKPLSIVIFVGFVVIALAANRENFIAYIHSVVLIVLLHNAAALATGYYAATLAKLAPQDRKTITIETGIQNSGLGLLLIFTFFDGLGGMALVAAWWGIWHIVAGLSIAMWLGSE